MRCALLIFVAVVSAASGYKSTSGYVTPTRANAGATAQRIASDDASTSTSSTSPSSSSSAVSAASSSTAKSTTSSAAPPLTTSANTQTPPPKDEPLGATEVLTELPIALPPIAGGLLPSDSDADLDASKRRRIFYDQRQEGQYNIRADLENFMIVLIPPSPSEGLSLLDLLTKSALRRSSLSTKSKRKHYSSGGGLGASKYRQQLKQQLSPAHLQLLAARQSSALDIPRSYFSGMPFASNSLDGGTSSSSAARLSDYIEGRTPYHVDISASDDEQARLHPDRPVDVLPPPYPLAYQHLIKPFHLEAEPTVIQALPPAELNAVPPRNYLDSYNQLLAPSARNSASGDVSFTTTTFASSTSPRTTSASLADADANAGYYRISRAIRAGDTNNLDTNRVGGANSNSLAGVQPVYRVEHSMGARDMYPPIDVPRHYPQPDARHLSLSAVAVERAQALEDPDVDYARIDPFFLSTDELPNDDYVEWDRFMDDVGKDMHGARCAPGQRRDSYGVCREVKGY